MLTFYSNEPLVATGTQGLYLPDVFIVPGCHDILDRLEVFLCEGVVDCEEVGAMRWGRVQHPCIIVDVMIDIVRAT